MKPFSKKSALLLASPSMRCLFVFAMSLSTPFHKMDLIFIAFYDDGNDLHHYLFHAGNLYFSAINE